MDNTLIHWIQDWYSKQCNGDWEHSYSIKIFNIDNPGWGVDINLAETELEGLEIDANLIEKSENDWYNFMVKDNVFKAGGDPSKLELLLLKFKEIVELYSTGKT